MLQFFISISYNTIPCGVRCIYIRAGNMPASQLLVTTSTYIYMLLPRDWLSQHDWPSRHSFALLQGKSSQINSRIGPAEGDASVQRFCK